MFARGVAFAQPEPAYGGPVDTAGELRAICGLAYAHAGRPDALDVLAGLLADPDRSARIAAAQGLGDAGRCDASALLRYKTLAGDRANAKLVEIVRTSERADAVAAAKALATFVADPPIAAKIREAATEQSDAAARAEIVRFVDE